jgi:heme-degrading monooxygenase HmoA
MLCALTVRNLHPGTFEKFREAFMRHANPDAIPDGWVRFNMVRGVENPDEVVCFGFFDGTLEELRGAGQEGYAEQMAAIAPYVASVGTNALFDVVEDESRASAL